MVVGVPEDDAVVACADLAEPAVEDPDEVGRAADELVQAGAESIAILFLWAFRNADNELRAKEAVAKAASNISRLAVPL